MSVYRYIAIDEKGHRVRGEIESANRADAVDQLRRLGRLPIAAVPARSSWWITFLHRDMGRTGLTKQDMAELTRELATMLLAGQDLDRCLQFIARSTPRKRVRRVVEAVREAVGDGVQLEAALRRHPQSFSPLYIGMVRSGVASGRLGQTLEQIGSLLEGDQALSAMVVSSLIGPGMLLLGSAGSIVLLLTVVLPEFVPLFEQSGIALPGPTRLLLSFGDVVTQYGLLALVGLGGATGLLLSALRRPGARLFADRCVLRIPVIGPLLKEVIASRFACTLGTLLTNGVPLLTSMDIAGEILANRAGRLAVAQARSDAESGAGIAKAVAASGVFPERLGSLLLLGEEAAQLGPMASRAAKIHETQARLTIQRLVVLLVPTTTVVMGAIVAWIVSALLLAMIGLNDLAN